MKKSVEHPRRRTVGGIPVLDKRCSLHNLQLKLAGFEELHQASLKSGAGIQSHTSKENKDPTNCKLTMAPPLKGKSSDRNYDEARISATKFKDFMRHINFFNIKPLVLQRRPGEENLVCSKKMLMVTGSSPKLGVMRKSMNLKQPLPKAPLEIWQSDAFDAKLKQYHQIVRGVWELHGMNRSLPMNYPVLCRALVKPGNNAKLVRFALKRRWWWSFDESLGQPQFVWSQLKDRAIFADKQKLEKVHNHLEHNYLLGSKKCLFYNMKNYYQAKGLNPFDFLPTTFHISSLDQKAYSEFVQCFSTRFNQSSGRQRKPMWIVKPAENTNRGRGITIHSDLNEIKEIIASGERHADGNLKTYILQAYIERPFLYNKRKFDIRCYMAISLLNGKLKGYWYQHGYIRTSSDQFLLENFDANIHLTNDAIQKHSQSYGKFEAGNKLSFYEFEKYLAIKHNGKYDFREITKHMKETARAAIQSTYKSIGGVRRHGVFELFGMDFMIDDAFRPWLIEINTNPCLETSCPVLERIIPALVEDLFKTCLDPMFPPPREWPSSRKYDIDCSQPTKMELIFDQSRFVEGVFPSSQVSDSLVQNFSKQDEIME